MLRRPNSKDETIVQQGQWNGEDDDDKNAAKHQRRKNGRVWDVRVTTFLCLIAAFVLLIYSISTVRRVTDLHLLDSITGSSNLTESPHKPQRELPEWAKDPELAPIATILQQAKYALDQTNIFDEETIESLPKWSHINEQFGPRPKIFGLGTCSTFQHRTASQAYARRIAVAGTFNSGTNLLSELLHSNCYIKERVEKLGLANNGMEWQVPWGKHSPSTYRGSRIASSKSAGWVAKTNITMVLPVVVVRDPYHWMVSMCRQGYAAQFEHNDAYCPNIIPYAVDIEAHPRFRNFKYIPVHVAYEGGKKTKYESLAHLWNSYYQSYFYKDNETHLPEFFPRLIVRLEDLWFRPKETISQICTCGGGTMRDFSKSGGFVHMRRVANRNAGIYGADKRIKGKNSTKATHHAGLLGSFIRYGHSESRGEKYNDIQLGAARDILDSELMSTFGYTYINSKESKSP